MDMSQVIWVKRSANRIFVKFEKSCEDMVTFKLVQTICIANVCKIAEDGRLRVEIGITLNVAFLTQCLE
jgi:hypothetical protein